MHGVNYMIITRLPARFARYGKVSTASGLLNTFVYLGSAASTYGFGAVTDRFGWQASLCCFAAAGVLGAALNAWAIPKWRRFSRAQ